MPLWQWWQMRSFVDWRLRLKAPGEDAIDFDADGWGDFDG